MLRGPYVSLVPLTGPAGVGKTRLAVEVAETLLADTDQNVFFVDLARLDDAAAVLPAIAETLAVKARPAEPVLESLISAVQEQPTVVVLHNFEHVLAAADQVAELLAGCPALKVLATSRSALQVRWEYEVRPRPLCLPPPTHDVDPDTRTLAGHRVVRRA